MPVCHARSLSFAALVLATLIPISPAATQVTVNPTWIDYQSVDGLHVNVSMSTNATVTLRVWADLDGNGSINTSDRLVYAARVTDNVIPRHNAPGDESPTLGQITTHLRQFTPIAFPYTTGRYIVEADDGHGSTDTAGFRVERSTGDRVVRGHVTDSATGQGVAGALVEARALSPACDDGPLSTIADGGGDYTLDLDVPSGWSCQKRVLVATAPGTVTDLHAGRLVELDTYGDLWSQDLTVSSSGHRVTGTVMQGTDTPVPTPYAVVIATAGHLEARAIADASGAFELRLPDGAWTLRTDPGRATALDQVAINAAVVTVAGADVADVEMRGWLPTRWTSGTVHDASTGSNKAGVRVALRCSIDGALGVTDSLGRFVLPSGLCEGTQQLEIQTPQHDRIATWRRYSYRGDVGSPDLTGQDLDITWGTGTVSGTVRRPDGTTVAGVCVYAQAGDDEASSGWVSWGSTDCNGRYTLPATGSTALYLPSTTMTTHFLGADPVGSNGSAYVSSQAQVTLDFTVSRDPGRLAILHLPAGLPITGKFEVTASGLTASTTATVDGQPATILALRPDLGLVVLDLATLGLGSHTVQLVDPVRGTSPAACFTSVRSIMSKTCTISGVARRSDGQALAGALVRATTTSGYAFGDAVTAWDGSWTISGKALLITPESRLVTIVPPAVVPTPQMWGSATLTCNAPATTTTLSTANALTVNVNDAYGRVLPGALVTLTSTGHPTRKGVTDGSGNVVLPASGSTTITHEVPPGVRWTPYDPNTTTVSSNRTYRVYSGTGVLLTGRTVDVLGSTPVYTQIDVLKSDGSLDWSTETDTCTGRFEIGRGTNPSIRFRMPGSATGTLATGSIPYRDMATPFEIRVAQSGNVQLNGLPHIHALDLGELSPGQRVEFEADGLYAGETVQVVFPAAYGRTVLGTGTVADLARGIVRTQVPRTAVSGNVVLQVGASSSPGVPFTFEPSLWGAGFKTYDLSVRDVSNSNPVAGILIALYTLPAGFPNCPDYPGPRTLTDYVVTDASGYAQARVPLGTALALTYPPAGTSLTGGPTMWEVTANGSMLLYVGHGVDIHARVVDASSQAVIPWAVVRTQYDQRMSDASGNVIIPDAYATAPLTVEGPFLSRYKGRTVNHLTAEAGDIALGSTLFVSGYVTDASGTAVAGSKVWTGPTAPYEPGWSAPDGSFIARAASSADGSPIPVQVSPQQETLDEPQVQVQPTEDTAYLGPAWITHPGGILSGTVRDTSNTPLSSVPLWIEPAPGTWFIKRQVPVCAGGKFRARVTAGNTLIHINPDGTSASYADEWFSRVFCEEQARPVAIYTGMTTTQDLVVDRGAWILGQVRDGSGGLANQVVEFDAALLKGCTMTATTAGSGSYQRFGLPLGTYHARTSVSGKGTQCYWDSDCSSNVAGITLTDGHGRDKVDFDFSAIPQPTTNLRVGRVAGGVKLTFPLQPVARGYNFYIKGLALGAPGSQLGMQCGITTGSMVINGDGTATYTYATGNPASMAYLVTASNTRREADDHPSSACGPTATP